MNGFGFEMINRHTHKAIDSKASVLKGNCLDIMKDIPDKSIDLIWTDPPYRLSNDGITVHAGKRVSVNKGDWDKSKGLEQDHVFNLTWIDECIVS